MSTPTTGPRMLVAALTLTGSGCIGNIGDGAGDRSGEQGSDTPGPSDQATCDGASFVDSFGPSPLQRLTRNELNNAFRDLLGDTTHPAEALPDDDRVGPFRSNSLTSVGHHTVALYASIASSLAEAAVEDLSDLLPCEPSEGEPCAVSFVEQFGRLSYRRPLTGEERDRLIDAFRVGLDEGDFANGIRLSLTAMLQSPHFLYRIEVGKGPPEDGVVELNDYELASRLSFFLWRSTPDDELLDAAEAGELSTPEGLRAQAERLLADARSDDAVQSFYQQLFGIDAANGLETLEKDSDAFPTYSPELKAAMDEEMKRFVTWLHRDSDGTLDTLLTSPTTFVDAELAELYGAESPAEGFVQIDLDPTERTGILTKAAVMAVQAGYSQTSPTFRGKLVRDALLCDVIPPPPPNVADDLPAQMPGQTKKDQLEQHMADPDCSYCHERMDPIGLGFENYDAIGRYRTSEGGVEIDPAGEVLYVDAVLEGPFEGPVELVKKLAKSEQVQGCMTRQWARFALGRLESKAEADCSYAPLNEAFVASAFDLRVLPAELVMLEAFRYRRIPNEEGN